MFFYKLWILKDILFENRNGSWAKFFELKLSLLKLPVSVLKSLSKKGTYIYYSRTCQETQFDKSENYSGYFFPKLNIIWIQDGYDSIVEYEKSALYHEIGHFIDYIHGYNQHTMSEKENAFTPVELELSNWIKSHYDKESTAYYHQSNPELFAQGFSDYILYPKHFKEECPKVVQFIQQLNQSIKSL